MKKLLAIAVASALLQACILLVPAQAAGGQDPAAAERTLRTVLEEARSGSLNLSRFEDDIVADVRANAGAVSGDLKRRGKVTAVQYLGKETTEAGDLHKFKVTFEKGQMLWSLSLNGRGQITNIDMQAR
ncbi:MULTISPECIES: hypothetical protein [Rhizobium/Agrobacterium group]|uniref:hypothetical protein n=1 Tax=Rhizobium/Agrobacterium group TaxID=227290 RepID=UPI001F2A6141|nr:MULTISPECIES: hypothetical protein [Rhizobium/Agrobacterium group]